MKKFVKKLVKVAIKRLLICFAALVLAVINSDVPVFAVPTGDDTHKGDIHYYTNNGIIFYEGGTLHCSTGGLIAGGAAAVLQSQGNLDKEWVPVILNAAKENDVDPIAMASLLFWEHRGFPKFGAGPGSGDSDSVGRGPWQITAGTWPGGAGPYHTAVYDPITSTGVAAKLVKSWGGDAGSPIGSIDQDFSKLKNLPSMATVAKNYNAGKYTWREPAVATYKQSGRHWVAPDRDWNDVNIGPGLTKADVIDDYILGMTFAYYTMATNTAQLTKGGGTNTSDFVAAALKNADKIKDFTFGGSTGTESTGNVANPCGSTVDASNVVQTARSLAWPNQEHDGEDRKSAARDTYQKVMPEVHGKDTANSVFEGRSAWSDCGVFVATVIRYSKADPTYYLRGTGQQRDYVIDNSKGTKRKYIVHYNYTNTSQVKPGDIFIVNGAGVGHTFIFVGKYKGDDGAKYDSTSASWGDHTPQASNAYFFQSNREGTTYHYIVATPLTNANDAATTAAGATP